MSLTSRLFASICLSSVILSGCTVDAQLASKLLSSLQNSVNEAGADDNAATLEDGSVVSAIADAGKNYQVVCGGDMSIASLDEEATDSTESTEATESTESTESTTTTETTSETALEEAEVVEPIVVAPVEATATAPAKRVRLSADLQGKLRQLGQYQGADRQRQFQDIQRNYPEMRNTQAVPVRSATGVQQAIFIYIGGQQAAAPTTQARPAMPANAAGHPFMNNQSQAGTRPGYGGQYGGQFGGQFGGHYGNSTAGKTGQATTRPVKATPAASAKPTTSTGTTRVGFAGSVEIGGQTCRVVARESASSTAAVDSTSSSSSDDSAAE